jgi:hypothetical protein
VQLTRYLSLVDITVAGVVAVAVFLPPRPVEAVPAADVSDEARWSLAAAEARWLAHGDDGAAAAELSRRLREARHIDWAVEVPLETAASPHARDRWRALVAASAAYDERLDVEKALELAQQALALCAEPANGCPAWEAVRVQFYAQQLEAGVKSGIDPRQDPKGFRRASGQALRPIRVIEP